MNGGGSQASGIPKRIVPDLERVVLDGAHNDVVMEIDPDNLAHVKVSSTLRRRAPVRRAEIFTTQAI